MPQLDSKAESIGSDMLNVIASIVMGCPNLERLVGFHPIYNHEFDRLTHALSTRRKLTEHVWLIGENDAITQRSHKQLAPGLMDHNQKESFLWYHDAWSSLTTLILHSPNQGILEEDVFANSGKSNDRRRVHEPGILQRLPALKRLCISNFDADDFTDYTLQQLPALHSLRLQDLEGVTFYGLSEFSRTANASSLRKLSLVNLDITYMSAISNLLLHLRDLNRFTLVQDTSPEIEEGEIVIQPIIASYTLEYIHWDIPVPGSANVNLANSIRANGFPRLRTIRVPSDHDGLIQALCKPRAQIELPGDQLSKADAESALATATAVDSLRLARRKAQQRIEEAFRTVRYKIVVEENNVAHQIFDLSGFMGSVGSQIYYSLEPDVPGSDTALIDVMDIVDGEGDGVGKTSCGGLRNAAHPKTPSWGRHAERPRYRPLDLQDLF